MLRATLWRILALLVIVVGGTAAASAILGALAGKSVEHALAVGYYVVGSAVLVASFVFGSRGPWRADPVEHGGHGALHWPGRGRRRKATPEERTEAKRNSLGLFALGIGLILLGAMIDPSRRVF